MKTPRIVWAALGGLGVLTSSAVPAAPLDLTDEPLFMGEVVTPNVFFLIDDSGSMDWDILTRQHWEGCAYDPDYGPDENNNDDCGSETTNGRIRSYTGSEYATFSFVYDSPDDAYSNACGDNWRAAENCLPYHGPLVDDWRVRSSGLNVSYYDPAVTYEPWPGFSDANFSGALSNPQPGTTGHSSTRNLADMWGDGSEGFIYEVWTDDKGYSGTRPQRGTNHNETATPNGEVDLWDSHDRIEFLPGGGVSVKHYVYDPIPDTNLDPTITETILSSTACLTELGGGAVSCRTIADAHQNVANWYQYARRRSFVAKAAVATVLTNDPAYRYGLTLINDFNDVFVEVPTAAVPDFATHNAGLLTDFYDYAWQSQNTPLRTGLERVGEYFDGDLAGTTDPIIHECQQHFAVTITDGYWNGGDPSVGDADSDGVSNSLADVAMAYYDTDLSGLANNVPASARDDNNRQHLVTFTAAFGVSGNLVDEVAPIDGWPDTDAAGGTTDWPAANGNWGNVFATPACDGGDCAQRIDDLWHAAYNGRGEYVAAQTPAEVADGLETALGVIAGRLSSAATVALNSGSLSTETQLYQARFGSGDWYGDLVAYQVSDGTAASGEPCFGVPEGSVCGFSLNPNLDDPLWSAGEQLVSQDYDTGRSIITYNSASGTGVSFRWANPTVSTHLSEEQVQYLRGDNTATFVETNNFRVRRDAADDPFVLGDVVNSAPAFVGAPNNIYPDDWGTGAPENSSNYLTWRNDSARKNRDRVVYVGANDGMLHGFDAGSYNSGTDTFSVGTGDEVLAYVPSFLLDRLSALTDPNYTHQYFVDASVTTMEAYFDDGGGTAEWHTVLGGALGGGGQGVFALDITDPSQFSETNADDLVLWEFGDTDDAGTAGVVEGDPELGYTLGQPVNIVRMHNGNWAAVLGNGLNSTEADGSASGTGNAFLLIVDLETGGLLRKIDTVQGMAQDPLGQNRPNGLFTPAPVDLDDDFIIDVIYAGDLFGNLWKFDVSSTNPANWEVAYGTTANPQPLFIATDGATTPNRQPILVRPEVGRSVADQESVGGVMIYFGTGKYIEINDNIVVADEPTQTFWGIWDADDGSTGRPFGRSDTVAQEILTEQTVNGRAWRTTSANDVNWTTIEADGSTTINHRGWRLDLIDPDDNENHGERVIFDAVLRGGRIIFTTLIPSYSPCEFGGDSWIMELDAATGSRLGFSPFDVNTDGAFTLGDFISDGGRDGSGNLTVDVAASGTKSAQGIVATPAILNTTDPGREYKFASGSSGAIESLVENASGEVGRQTWIEIAE